MSSVVRIGLLGLGNVGGAVARMTRACAAPLRSRGIVPVISAALVRSTGVRRAAAPLVARLTSDPDDFFREPLDIVVEALGGIEPAYALVTMALDRSVPVVTANKSLIAAHGDELCALARRRGTALRFEASCIAGVPFLGAAERRPLASRVNAVTAILNGTSNSIVSALDAGTPFDGALEHAQRRGLAEPDPSADVSGADAAQKLAILVRLYGGLVVDANAVPSAGIDLLEPGDLAAARDLGGRIKPLAHAAWEGTRVRAFVSPAFVPHAHPLAAISHVTNGVLLDAHDGPQCYTGPGAGPAVTAATLLDDVVEIATENRVRTPAPIATQRATRVERPLTGWFLRVAGPAPARDVADLLGSYGAWCSRIASRSDHLHALTFPVSDARIAAAAAALRRTGASVVALPALEEEGAC